MPPKDTPFSQPTRQRFIDDYFGDRIVDPETAWKDVYRLLLWVDTTTGLAHCYESDKAQPGRHWYPRSLAFHKWVAEQLGVDPHELASTIDTMFRHSLDLTSREEEAARRSTAERAAKQREPYGDSMPLPNEDPELAALLEPLLPADELSPQNDVVREVIRAMRRHITSENKRKNLLGRGFEDVLAGVVGRLPGAARLKVGTQTPIQHIPGFRQPRAGDKAEKVDLHVLPPDDRRILVSAKWSVRSDREKQMRGDFNTYVDCNNVAGEGFEYVWITNEFDPARLVKNANHREGNQQMLDAVVHICPDALRVAHGLDGTKKPHKTVRELNDLLDAGRIIGLNTWLTGLAQTA